MKFEGVIPALITPLNEDETVNTTVLTELISYLLDQGADGFYVGGATGEGIALSAKQRMILAEGSVAAAKGKSPALYISLPRISTRRSSLQSTQRASAQTEFPQFLRFSSNTMKMTFTIIISVLSRAYTFPL